MKVTRFGMLEVDDGEIVVMGVSFDGEGQSYAGWEDPALKRDIYEAILVGLVERGCHTVAAAAIERARQPVKRRPWWRFWQ
jgi:hypothetical protein